MIIDFTYKVCSLLSIFIYTLAMLVYLKKSKMTILWIQTLMTIPNFLK